MQSPTFLGITTLYGGPLDTQKVAMHLQPSCCMALKNGIKRDILSLVGLSQHATEVLKPVRTFVSRMYTNAAKVKKLSHIGPDSPQNSNQICTGGTCLLLSGMALPSSTMLPMKPPFDHQIWTDTSGTWGCGV